MRIRGYLSLAAASVAAAGNVAAGEPISTCTPAESVHVESSVARLRDWQGVYHAYRINKSCNGENVVEVWGAYSQVISNLLAKDWKNIDQLSRLTRKDAAFETFVLTHLSDETIPEDVLAKIRLHASRECNAGQEALCAKLSKATE
ncbi:hypothetical protein [Luteibacter sp. 22Crub2.1]|uniref:hypothetical protein n=1 Tax=Luteibacter sp. 22Crub2.1 TaxID=1283288 RepID=UPI0011164BA5|nr:hypothetical protein [Luteibacter sp. 22Crub2.1]